MFDLRGLTGEVRCGYQVAVRLVSGRLYRATTTLGDTSATFTGTEVYRNVFWAAQANLALWVAVGDDWWVWRAVTIADGAFRVEGEPEFLERT